MPTTIVHKVCVYGRRYILYGKVRRVSVDHIHIHPDHNGVILFFCTSYIPLSRQTSDKSFFIPFLVDSPVLIRLFQ